MLYKVTIGEKINLGNYEQLQIKVSEEFDKDITSKEVAIDIVSDKADYFIMKRLGEIQERKLNKEKIKRGEDVV